MNHIDDSFLHCLVFKEHRRIASSACRSRESALSLYRMEFLLSSAFFVAPFARTVSLSESFALALIPHLPPYGDLYNDTGFLPACQHLFDFLLENLCVENGVLGGTRTPDPLIRSQIL